VDALRWQRIDSVFQAVLEMEPAERDRYLAAMGEDEDVSRAVRELLDADGQAAGFLENAAAHVPDPGRLVGPTLAPGMVLSDRFRLVRFLAEGGMGEVYEAEDLELRANVAVKIVQPEVARDRAVMERFRREVQLARQVTHLSVCRCFDIFRHAPTATEAESALGPLTFLTMELIRGETLSEWLQREGPMSTAQALPILEQVAAALAAAHERGIVHRDLKPSNVMLDRSGPGLRVVVTDFGLALSPGASEEARRGQEDTRPDLGRTLPLPSRREHLSITGRGQVLGTPAYMAPEQLLGAKISPATDIYALGVLMYQMLTGHAPFEDEDEGAMALKRLSEPPPSPRLYLPDLDPRWERTILRCLERAPDKRFASTHEVLASLHEAAPRVRRSRWWIAATAAAAIAGAGMIAIPRGKVVGPQAGLDAGGEAGLDVNHGLVLAKAEQDLRSAEASSDPKLRADAHYRIARARQHLNDHQQALESAQEAEKLYRSLSDRMGQAQALAVQAAVLAAQSRSDQAIPLYQRALALFEELGHTPGIVKMNVSVAPLLAGSGDTDGAMVMLERARGLARDIGDRHSEAGALFNLAWIREKRDELDRAQPLYEQALALAREHGYKELESIALNHLAILLRGQGKLGEAEARFWEALSIARAIGDKAGVSSRLNNLALTLRLQGKLDSALDKLEEALDVAEDLDDHKRVAQRLTHMATILRMQGRLAEARARLDQAMDVHQKIDDPGGRASTLRCLGLLRLAEGDLSEARSRLDEAVAIRRELEENTAELLLAQRARAVLAMEEGHLVEAERLTREIIEEHVALAQQDEELEDRLLLARLLLLGERVADARKAMERARSLARDSQDRERRLRTDLVSAEVDAASGARAQAVAALDGLAQEANGYGMVELALEARLARAGVALADGRPGALDVLDVMIQDAETRGFVNLAKKARGVKGSR
jgi:tetratricopeptide (TPR) repeat protein/tRNA A-37 threonylcarbamoyl transferase component Bud32